jgi:hypothetical protein
MSFFFFLAKQVFTHQRVIEINLTNTCVFSRSIHKLRCNIYAPCFSAWGEYNRKSFCNKVELRLHYPRAAVYIISMKMAIWWDFWIGLYSDHLCCLYSWNLPNTFDDYSYRNTNWHFAFQSVRFWKVLDFIGTMIIQFIYFFVYSW